MPLNAMNGEKNRIDCMRSERFINNVAKIAAIQFEMPGNQQANKLRKMSSGFFIFQMTGECYGTMYTMYT